MPSRMTLKWGTLKEWKCESQSASDALKKWAGFGYHASCMMHEDKPGQKEALISAMDFFDEFYLEWEGKSVSREEAKAYILNYKRK